MTKTVIYKRVIIIKVEQIKELTLINFSIIDIEYD